MSRVQFTLLCAVAFVGCFMGGFLGQSGPLGAFAQSVPQVVPGGQVQIRSENTLFVPDAGLRMVNAKNRVLGVISERDGNGGLVLFDAAGRPSVSVMAGPAGFVEINAGAPVLRVGGPTGQGVVITANEASASLKLRNGVSLVSADKGGQLSINSAKGAPALQLDSHNGGTIVGQFEGKSVSFELKSDAEGGLLSLYKEGSEAGFQASGSGSAMVRRDKETLWKVPSD